MTNDLSTPILAINHTPLAIKVYPNPTANAFFVNLMGRAQSKATIEVMNEIGAIVYEQRLEEIKDKPVKIDLWNQADGLYLIRIIVDGELPILKKMVKTSR